MACNKNKPSCCSSDKSEVPVGGVDDPVMISMVATGVILVTGFLVIAFYSGPFGLIVTLALLSALGLYYAIRG